MSNLKKEKEVASELKTQYGLSNAYASALVSEYGYLIKEHDTKEFAAQKIYSLNMGSNSILTDKSAILETQLMNAGLILRGAMRLLQTEHSQESIKLQNHLQSVFYQLEQINSQFVDIFTKKEK